MSGRRIAAMVVNDSAYRWVNRVALAFFAGKPAPTMVSVFSYSIVEEHRLGIGTLQNHVPLIHTRRILLGQQRTATLCRHAFQQRIVDVGRLAIKVNPRQQVLHQATGKHQHHQVRRLGRTFEPLDRARLDGGEAKTSFGICLLYTSDAADE